MVFKIYVTSHMIIPTCHMTYSCCKQSAIAIPSANSDTSVEDSLTIMGMSSFNAKQLSSCEENTRTHTMNILYVLMHEVYFNIYNDREMPTKSRLLLKLEERVLVLLQLLYCKAKLWLPHPLTFVS